MTLDDLFVPKGIRAFKNIRGGSGQTPPHPDKTTQSNEVFAGFAGAVLALAGVDKKQEARAGR